VCPGADGSWGEIVALETIFEVQRRSNPAANLVDSTATADERRAPPEPADHRTDKPPPSYLPDEPRLLVGLAIAAIVVIALAFLQGFLVGRRRRPAAKT
jgi:hypothetical protein